MQLNETTINQVIAEDALCLESKTKGHFRESGGVERISFFTGSGEAIQSGGYSVGSSPSTQFGIDLQHLLFGTNNHLGIPYEIVLQAVPRH